LSVERLSRSGKYAAADPSVAPVFETSPGRSNSVPWVIALPYPMEGVLHPWLRKKAPTRIELVCEALQASA
jgi:hypothetical protein